MCYKQLFKEPTLCADPMTDSKQGPGHKMHVGHGQQTKMAATVCDFDLRFLLVSSTDFDGWGSSKDQTKDK